MSQWGRIKLNLDAGNQFTDAEADVEATEDSGTLRTFVGMTVGGRFDLSFIRAGVLEIKRLIIDAGNATTWQLQVEVTTEAGTESRILIQDTDFVATPNQQIWHADPDRRIVDVAHGDKLFLVTTGATQAMSADLILSSW
jgi:hypothetical protein